MKEVTLTNVQNTIQGLYEKQYKEAKDYLLSVWTKEEYNMIDIPKKYFDKDLGCYDSKSYFSEIVRDADKSYKFIKKYKDNLTAMAYYYVFSLEFNINSIDRLYSNNGNWINMTNK